MITIDGSSGGGQMLRTALGLSAVSSEDVTIKNIRGARKEGGLKPQHLEGLRAVARLCNAEVSGDKIGSTEVIFKPRGIEGGKIEIDTRTAGAVSLILQTLMIPAIHASRPVVLTMRGGTDVPWSPPMAYVEQVLLRHLTNIGVTAEIETEKRGFYPKGGGLVHAKLYPGEPRPVVLVERGELERIDTYTYASLDLQKSSIIERAQKAVEAELELPLTYKMNYYVPTDSPGLSVHLHAHYENTLLGAESLGGRGKRSEDVGKQAAVLLKRQMESNACFDEWAADQVLPYLALACEEGESRISAASITDHVRTNVHVIEQFLPVKFELKERLITVRRKT